MIRTLLHYGLGACLLLIWPAMATAASIESAYKAFQQGKFNQAQALLQTLQRDGGDPTSIAWLRGHIAYAQKRYGQASQAYQTALQTCAPLHKPWLHNDLGNAYYRQKQWRRAVHHYAKALTQRPKYERARYNLELAVQQLQKQKKRPPPPPRQNRPPPPPPPRNRKKKRRKPPKKRDRGLKPHKSPPRMPKSRHFKLKPFDRFIPYSRVLRHKKARDKARGQ